MNMSLKKPITFRRPLKLANDLASIIAGSHGVDDGTHFGRGVRGVDEIEYVYDGHNLFEIQDPDGPSPTFRLMSDGSEKTDVLLDLAEQIRVVDHTPGYAYYTPPGAQAELAPERYWRNKPQKVLRVEGKVTETEDGIKIDTSRDEDQN